MRLAWTELVSVESGSVGHGRPGAGRTLMMGGGGATCSVQRRHALATRRLAGTGRASAKLESVGSERDDGP